MLVAPQLLELGSLTGRGRGFESLSAHSVVRITTASRSRPGLIAVPHSSRAILGPVATHVLSKLRGTRSARARSDLLPTGVEVEAESDEFDRSVGGKLANDSEARDEQARGDHDAVIGATRDELGQRVPLDGELLDDAE